MTCHYIGDDLHHLIVAATAAGGAMGDILYTLKGGKHIVEIGQLVEGVQNVAVTDLLAIANHIIFNHSNTSIYNLWIGDGQAVPRCNSYLK